ncbi:MAG: Gfo/Idh/MocA family oxidoreductase [Anaerohalosphaeraceae bacterium]|nr:Gfo/Idh/MocA family oxidoreductase [Anaerohalosphaeraceae bacterium]
MKKLRVASIGGFGHSSSVFNDMIEMDEVELVATAKAYDTESLDKTLNHKIWHGGIEVFDNYRDMLKQVQPDVAVISTRLDKIAEVTIAAANAGCHLICEKPLAIDHKSLCAVYKAVKSNGVQLTAMLTSRNSSVFRTARQVYASGVIGELILANGRKSYKWGTRPDWFGERAKYGGTIGWVGIHALDVINYITELEFTSVAAMTGNFAHNERPDCDDNCALILEMSNGGHATVSVDYFRPSSAPTHGDDWVRIVGTKGIVEASDVEQRCTVIVEGKESYDVPLVEPGRIFREFLSSLLGKTGYNAVQSESFMLTNVCLCAQDSADNRGVVKIIKL